MVEWIYLQKECQIGWILLCVCKVAVEVKRRSSSTLQDLLGLAQLMYQVQCDAIMQIAAIVLLETEEL
jgi:hypothetical protein